MFDNVTFLIPCKINLNNENLFLFVDLTNGIYYNSDFTVNDSIEVSNLFQQEMSSPFNFFMPPVDLLQGAMKLKEESLNNVDSFYEDNTTSKPINEGD